MNSKMYLFKKYKYILIFTFCLVLYKIICGYFNFLEKKVIKTPISGNVKIERVKSVFSETKDMPIIRAWNRNNKIIPGSQMDSSLFTLAKDEKIKSSKILLHKSTTEKNNNLKDAIIFYEKLKVDALFNASVFINNHFYKESDYIKDVYISPNGKMYRAKIIKINDNGISLKILNNTLFKKV